MSIDKNSTGLPEVDLRKKTTQVNVWMIAAVVAFLLGASALAYWTSHRSTMTESSPAPATPPGR